MSANAYELLALAMRYVFVGLMLLIVLRAWRITVVDSRRAAKLRRLSPDTGIIGEMLVVNGSERARPGMKYSITLEGTIGSGRRADIRVRHSTVKSRHAIYQMTDEGLFVRGHAHARIRDGHGRMAKQLLLQDGEILRVGDVALMVVLADAGNMPDEINRSILRRRGVPRRDENREDFAGDMDAQDGFGVDMDDGLFETRPAGEDQIDDLFLTNPAGNFRSGDDYNEF